MSNYFSSDGNYSEPLPCTCEADQTTCAFCLGEIDEQDLHEQNLDREADSYE